MKLWVLDKEKLCNKLVALYFFWARWLPHTNRMKIDFQPSWDSLNRVWMVNRKCCFSRKDKTISRKKHSLFVFLLGANYMQKGSEIEFSSLAKQVWFCLMLVRICSLIFFPAKTEYSEELMTTGKPVNAIARPWKLSFVKKMPFM